MAGNGTNYRKRGAQYERMAATYLKQQGFEILHQNFNSCFGEIDLVARDGTYLVFVEVKYRKNDRWGHPLEAVGMQKQQRICRTADHYCLRYGYDRETPCRFDVVGIMGGEVIHVKNAFSYTSGGCGFQ